MNNNSYICSFISEHPNDFEELLLKKYMIKIKRNGSLAIFNYGYDSDFTDNIVQEARGIIINTDTLNVVCWPFRKFGNYSEHYADNIDWDNARVLEKIDGSIIKLWYNDANNSWQFSTNGMINAFDANIEGQPHMTYGQIIKSADNYKDIPFDTLSRDTTYIFELVSPITQIVVKYNTPSLYHIGTRNNLTGIESDIDIGIKKPRAFPINSLSDCINAALELNSGNDENIESEGFVVVDKSFRRVKVKSPDYIMTHKTKSMRLISCRDAVAMLLSSRAEVDNICKINPALTPIFKYYDYQLTELLAEAECIVKFARNLFCEYSGDRRAVAQTIGKHRMAFIAFRALQSDESAEELLLSFSIEKIVNFIPDYEPKDYLASIFKK